MSRRAGKRTGWYVFGYGVALLILGAVFLFNATGDTWATVGLVLGLLGGGGMGTGLSLLLFPEHESRAEWEDEEPYTRTYSWVACTRCEGVCEGHED